MRISKTSRILIVALQAGVLLLFLLCILAGFVLRELSAEVAAAYPDLAYMRWPVFGMGLGMIAVFAVDLALGEVLLVRIRADRIFTPASAAILRAMSGVFLAGLVPFTALFVYTAVNVHGSITQIYVVFGAGVYLMAGLVFRLFAGLIADASAYKQEVDLTV